MSNSYTLDDLRDALDKEFAPVTVDGVVLRNVMRLGKDDRESVLKAISTTQSAETSTPEGMNQLLESIRTVLGVVGSDGKGAALAKKIGDDVALAVKVMELWSEGTNPGEADSSQR